ncbi:DNA polymerase III subunit gamma/tau [Patescibacteria group bacterium]
MDNLSLYRKYRPHDFDNLIGQDHITSTLVNAFKSGHVSHAYLFSGPRGTGKTSSARLIAKALSCTKLKDKYNPCNKCEFCEDINSGRLIDLIEIDAASNRGIDEIRDLKEKINFAPSRADYKVYIIDEVHMLTKEAFNALLKTLEEPPAHAYFVLATTEIHKIPDTIISRCQRFDFRRISDEDLINRLKYIAKLEKIKSEDGVFNLISKYSDGCMRDAIGLLEQLVLDDNLKIERVREILGVCEDNLLSTLNDHLLKKQTKEALEIIEELHSQGTDLKQFLHEFMDFLRGKMLDSVMKNDLKMTNTLVKIIEIFREAQKHSFISVPQLSLEIAVVKVGLLFRGIQDVIKKEEKEEKVKTEEKNPKPESDLDLKPKTNEAPVKTTNSNEEKETAVEANFELTLDSLQDNWPRVTERVKIPRLRMSIKNAKVTKIDGADVTLTFSSKFHRDQVMDHDNRVSLEQTIQEIVKSPIKIITKISEMDIKPVVEDSEASVIIEEENSPNEEHPQGEGKEKEVVNEVMDIFGGGKVVE